MEIEKETVLRMAQGDKNAFCAIFHKFYPKIHQFALMLLKNPEDADDVSQMVFMKMWVKRERFTAIDDFDSYLFILTKNTVINYIAAKKVIPMNLDELPDQPDAIIPSDHIIAKDTQLLIDMVVENMPKQRQTIYRMSREQHLSNEEIAQQLGLQKKTVENHLNLALKEVKKALYLMILLTYNWV